MVYVSSSLIYKRRFDLENIRLETVWVEIKLKSFNLLLCCFYRNIFFCFSAYVYYRASVFYRRSVRLQSVRHFAR